MALHLLSTYSGYKQRIMTFQFRRFTRTLRRINIRPFIRFTKGRRSGPRNFPKHREQYTFEWNGTRPIHDYLGFNAHFQDSLTDASRYPQGHHLECSHRFHCFNSNSSYRVRSDFPLFVRHFRVDEVISFADERTVAGRLLRSRGRDTVVLDGAGAEAG